MKSDIAMSGFNYNIEKTLNIKEQVEKLSMDIFCSDYIQNNLAAPDNQISNIEFSNAVKQNLKTITNNVLYTNYIGIFGRNGKIYKSNWSNDELFIDYTSCRAYMDINKINYLNKWFKPQKNLYYGNLRDQYAVFYFQVIRDIDTLEETGILVIAVNRSSLLTVYDKDDTDTFIMDGEGNMLASVNEAANTDYSKAGLLEYVENIQSLEGYYRTDIANVEYLVFYSKIPDNNWYIFSLVPYSLIISDCYRIGIATALILAVFMFIAIVFSFLLTKSLTKPILRLYHLMDKVKEGDLTVRFNKTNNDEINELGENFNQMIETIDNYLNEIREQQQLMKTSQMSLMQAQVNPHMLYNTMDSLQYYINNGKIKKVNAILYAMSRFFKISLSHGDVIISIHDEILHALSYIDIQNNCFNTSVKCIIDIPENLMNKMIIKMTLQPIIENCILHGFKNYLNNGEIRIDAQTDGHGRIILNVTDNGMGIMAIPLAHLNDYLNSEDDNTDIDKPFGIINVNRRIKHFFGSQFGIKIESDFGVFTRVIITIPENHTEE